jgi:hypothetical protein
MTTPQTLDPMDRLALPNENDPKYRLPNGRFNNDMFQTDLRAVEEHNERVYLHEQEATDTATATAIATLQNLVVANSPTLMTAVNECKKLIKSDLGDKWLQLILDARKKIHACSEATELIQTRLEHKAATTKTNKRLDSKITWLHQQVSACEGRIEKQNAEAEAWKQKTKRQTDELETSIELLDTKLMADIQALQARRDNEVAKIRERIESKQKKLEGHLKAFSDDVLRSTAYVAKLKVELDEMKTNTTILPDKTDYVTLATLRKDLVKLYTKNEAHYELCSAADKTLEEAVCAYYGKELHKLTEDETMNCPWVRESKTLGDYELKHTTLQTDLRAVLNAIEEMMGGASLSDMGSLSSRSSTSTYKNEVVFNCED